MTFPKKLKTTITALSLLIISDYSLHAQTLEEFKAMLNQEMQFHQAIIDFEVQLGAYEVDRSSRHKYDHKLFFEGGVELVVEKDTAMLEPDKLATIFLMGPHDNWYKPYAGTLPLGLEWGMTQNEVEQLIGKGETYMLIESYLKYQYPNHHIEIEYTSQDKYAEIKTIQIRSFD